MGEKLGGGGGIFGLQNNIFFFSFVVGFYFNVMVPQFA